jgi:hypothetical protein
MRVPLPKQTMPRESIHVCLRDGFRWDEIGESDVTHSLRVKPTPSPPFMLQTKAWEPMPPYSPPTTSHTLVLPATRTSRSVELEVFRREIATQEGAASIARRNYRTVLQINAALAKAMKNGT